MDTLNPARFQLLVSQFRQNYDIFKSDSMSISAVNWKEDVFFWNLTYIRHLFIGVEINQLSSQIGNDTEHVVIKELFLSLPSLNNFFAFMSLCERNRCFCADND